jgi:hypothetical protein
MKQCPRCHQTYNDDQLNFCLEDGELLTSFSQEPPPTRYGDDSPPTVMFSEARVTNPANWPQSPPSAPPVPWNQPNMQNVPFASPGFARSKDQTIPTISLILGIASIVLICCYGGIWLGAPAAVLGYLGIRNADNDRNKYGGRGLAIGGMVLGVISFLASMAVALVAIVAS